MYYNIFVIFDWHKSTLDQNPAKTSFEAQTVKKIKQK